jgi:hypothetical protein
VRTIFTQTKTRQFFAICKLTKGCFKWKTCMVDRWWLLPLGQLLHLLGCHFWGFLQLARSQALWRRGESVVPGVELRGASPPFSQLL